MAFLQVDFYSNVLHKITNICIVLPNDLPKEMKAENDNYKRKMKTLILLHGYSGSEKDWLAGSLLQELAGKYNLAVIMPSGDNSFYLDGKGVGKAYCQYIGQELVDYVRNTFQLSNQLEDTYIGGYSMGGFGAIHTALAFPETFKKAVAFSSALIIHNIEYKKEDFVDPAADYYYYKSVFGDLDQLDNSLNNPEYQILQLKKYHINIPELYMACGTEDFLLQENRAFINFLKDQEVKVNYTESAGAHDWTFWNQYTEPAIQWLLETTAK